MTTADALTAAVCAAPDDDLPRLVYADWCEESGHAERAEFIRLQVAHANHRLPPAGVIREKVLLDTHATRWLAPLREPGQPLFTRLSHGTFRRGFIEEVWMPARWFRDHAERLFAVCPVRHLRASVGGAGEFSLLGECEHLTRLRELDLSVRRCGPAGVARLACSPHLSRLAVLRLRGCGIDDAAADGLCNSRLSLATLDLRHNPLSLTARKRLRERFGPAVVFD